MNAQCAVDGQCSPIVLNFFEEYFAILRGFLSNKIFIINNCFIGQIGLVVHMNKRFKIKCPVKRNNIMSLENRINQEALKNLLTVGHFFSGGERRVGCA